MKYFYTILFIFIGIYTANAQITIEDADKAKTEVSFKDELKPTSFNPEYFNLARYKAERAAIRKERNYFEMGGGVFGSLTSYSDSWIATSGGDNTIALTANIFLRHTFTKGLFSIETKFDAKFGYNRMKVETTTEEGTISDGVWFKNQDEFAFSTAPSFKMTKNWSYGSIIKFRSQFVNGYKSRTEQKEEHRKSSFMTPGYLDASLGITYKCPKSRFPVVVNLSPLAISGTFVESDLIRKNGFTYGIEDPDKSSKYEGGSSIQIDFDRKFGKKEIFRYRTTIFGFYGWITNMGQKNQIGDYAQYKTVYDKWVTDGKNIKEKPVLPIHPTIRWENYFEIKATKYLATTFNFQLYYNRAQNLDIQTQMLLSVGLTYTFKNK